MLNRCHVGDCRALLREFAAAGVKAQTCVTSPPYFGLRDYGVDGQIGLEQTPDEYVAELVDVFRGVRDVLADDGTLWLNLGDSYAAQGGGKTAGAYEDKRSAGATWQPPRRPWHGFKPKDLIGIPWRVAFALQADGWYLRSDIIWHKPNPMPESVTDRPTKAHEYLFLLAKSERYYYDAASIAVQATDPATLLGKVQNQRATGEGFEIRGGLIRQAPRATVNRRTVWSISPRPFDGAHFAVYPPELVEPCILAGSRSGDVVLDPFMGSGTTAQVAEHLGRQWIGCELNPDYLPLQAQRLAQRALAL